MRTLSTLVGLSGLLGGLGLPIYWWITYSGVYRWLAEVQLGWFDAYYAILTGVIGIVVGLVGMTVPAGMLAAAIEPADDPAAPAPDATPAPRVSSQRRSSTIGCLVMLGVLVVPIIGIGVWQLVRAAQAGPEHALDLAAMEAGTPPPTTHATVEVRPGWSEVVSVRGRSGTDRFVPVRSDPRAVAAVLLELPAEVDPGRIRWTGTLYRSAPGLVRSTYAEHKRVVDDPWVLEVDRSPDDVRTIGWSMIEVSGGLFVMGLIAIAILRRRWSDAPRG